MAKVVGAEVLAQAVELLRTRGDPAAADLLAACMLDIVEDHAGDVRLELVGSLVTQPGPLDLDLPMARVLTLALREVIPSDVWIDRLWARPADSPTATGSTDTESLESTSSVVNVGGLNQAVGELAPRTWAGMRFRSESELRIAQALDRTGVLFLPDALMRLGASNARQNREADFLVCANGVWGILEVDGAPFHTDNDRETAAERDQLFRQHGIPLAEHFEAARCAASADAVVAEFLAALDQLRCFFEKSMDVG
jgi:hypothetical protein